MRALHLFVRPEKNVCLPTQLGACSHPTGRSTVPYWCTIDVRTPWARRGVPTGPPGPRRDPTAARRPAGGSVRLIFIGGPRFGRPAAPIGAGRGYCRLASSMVEQDGLCERRWEAKCPDGMHLVRKNCCHGSLYFVCWSSRLGKPRRRSVRSASRIRRCADVIRNMSS